MNNNKTPSAIKTLLYIASRLVIIAYIAGALFSTFFGIGFLFSSSSGLGGLLTYHALLVILVVPALLIAASFIYIIVYLDKWK